jgi:hypothetical protein
MTMILDLGAPVRCRRHELWGQSFDDRPLGLIDAVQARPWSPPALPTKTGRRTDAQATRRQKPQGAYGSSSWGRSFPAEALFAATMAPIEVEPACPPVQIRWGGFSRSPRSWLGCQPCVTCRPAMRKLQAAAGTGSTDQKKNCVRC